MSRRTLGRRRRAATAALVASILAAPACSSGGDDDSGGSSATSSSSTTIPASCQVGDPSVGTTAVVSEACAEQQFFAGLEQPDNAAAKDVPRDQALVFARSLCGYASTLFELPTLPTFDELMDSNATTWKVSRQAAEAIARAALPLCPDGIPAIYSLRSAAKPVSVTYRVEGAGEVRVTYTSGDDGFGQQVVTAPWTATVDANSSSVLSIIATPSDPSAVLTCSIEVGSKQLIEEQGDPADAGIAACSVPMTDARRAVREDD